MYRVWISPKKLEVPKNPKTSKPENTQTRTNTQKFKQIPKNIQIVKKLILPEIRSDEPKSYPNT